MQIAALAITLKRAQVAYQIKDGKLWITPSNGVIQSLPFTGSCADLVHVERGRWEAHHPWDGRLLASGVSQRDVVAKTIRAITGV